MVKVSNTIDINIISLWVHFLQKRGRSEENEEEKDPVNVLKAVGEVGKGFVRSIYLLKSPRLRN